MLIRKKYNFFFEKKKWKESNKNCKMIFMHHPAHDGSIRKAKKKHIHRMNEKFPSVYTKEILRIATIVVA